MVPTIIDDNCWGRRVVARSITLRLISNFRTESSNASYFGLHADEQWQTHRREERLFAAGRREHDRVGPRTRILITRSRFSVVFRRPLRPGRPDAHHQIHLRHVNPDRQHTRSAVPCRPSRQLGVSS